LNNAKPNAGESYVIFGGASLPSSIDLANLGTIGITIFGAEAGDSVDRFGRSRLRVSSAGDVNGDGFGDLLIGTGGADASSNAKTSAGDSYVIFGGPSLPTTIDLANLGTAGTTIFGADAYDQSGFSVSSAGDVNGDGFDDLLIGAYYGDSLGNSKRNAGESYVIFGGASLPATIDLANLGAAGVTIYGADAVDYSGVSVSRAGDVNGDGFDDLIIGAYWADASGNAKSRAGDSYVIFGRASMPATIDLANLGTAGITLFGVDAYDNSGFAVSGVGDMNGDGFDDLLIGARGADALGNAKSGAGDSYVIFGGASLPPTIDLANLGTAGITLFGADADDYSGFSVSSAGDVNGDGFDDLLIGAPNADASGNAKSNAGESYVIFGSDFTASITHPGTAAGETLIGTAASNVMNGGRGNDILIGNGGADVLIGGQGNDVLAVSDLTFKRIVGGTGSDTLRLDGSGLSLNLTTLRDNRLLGIEQIDITGSGNNTLTLNQREVLNISDESNTLLVQGNSLDRVLMDGGWTRGADDVINTFTYRVLTKGAATLKVAAAISIQITMIDLASPGTAGMTLFGADVNDQSGISVSSAGDVNGDGFDDLLIGANSADALGNAKPRAGDTYVIFGGPSMPASIDLANLGTSGITIFGADAFDQSGISVSSAGDVNGDGFDDLLIGAVGGDALNNAKPNAGDSYVIFGGASLPPTINLANLGTAGITIFGAEFYDRSGISVSSGGDVNGDGFDDLLIGASTASASNNAKYNAGDIYVIFGGRTLPPTIDLANLGTAGITIFGADARDNSGMSVSSAGDVNGDGFDDLLIGASYADASGNAEYNAGESYVIFGGASLPTTIDLANLGRAGITIFGADVDDYSGNSVSSGGDVNGDGFDDLLIGARFADALGNAKANAGDSYVIFGGASLPATIDLADLGTAGITLFGADVDDRSGFSVSSAGDVNGDGFDDLLIGAVRADALGNAKARAGDSYVIFGGASLPTTIDLANLGTAGITLFGADAGDQSGGSVSSAGDVNGDGFDDLLIGALFADASGNAKSDAGESYLIFGGDFTSAVTHAGTAAGETLTGTSAANVMIGGRGNDILIGNGGADVLIGGQGNDVLAVSDLPFKRIVGGTGSDTLRLDGSGLFLNLTTLRDNRLLGIEQIDITGSGNNTLMLNQREVLNLSDETNTLLVQGNSLDRVLLDNGWTRGSDEIINTVTYRVLTKGAATLKVAAAISLQTATIDLASLGTDGMTLFGADADDVSGRSVSSAGDVNGDGFDDLLIGAYLAAGSGNAKPYAGNSYVIFGGPSLPTTIDLANLGTAGITIFGAESYDLSGASVSSAGDVNGDGFDDLLIGAPFADASDNAKSYAGDSYVIFGGASLPPTIDLANLGTAGITIFGVDAYDQSSFSVSSAGDVNGDGFDDLLIGARYANSFDNAKSGAGESYLIFGGPSLPTTIDLANLGTAGITIFGADSYDTSGFSVSSAGDVNGDGFDDLLIGAFRAASSDNAKPNAGESYVIFGGRSLPPTIDLANLGTAGIIIFGAESYDTSGYSVSSAGDVNGDGFDDLLIGAYRADASGNTESGAGDSYVIFGGASLPPTIDLANLGTAGITLFGAEAGDRSGGSVSSAGDVNGDGFDDLLIGARGANSFDNAKSGAGESYLIFGGPSLPTTIDLANLGAAGITLFGVDAGDSSGRSVSSAGDVNGDGFDDLLIGASGASAFGNAKSGAGDSYVIFGSDFTGAITHAGTAAGETLIGTAAANVMNGGRGNDILIGNGGADVLTGGQGNDVLAVSDLTFKRIVGGTGSDTLRLDGSGMSLNLTTLRDNRLLGIEQIDITGSGNNTLMLNRREVLNISDESNTLVVRRNPGDVVNILDLSSWTQAANETLGPDIFHVYTQGAATLKVQTAFTTIATRGVMYVGATGSSAATSLATDKVPLLPGQSSTYANYTNYNRGLNGLVVDVVGLPATVTETQLAASLQFANWNGIAAAGFVALPLAAVPTVSIVQGGVAGSRRVQITFPDNTVQNTWLRVTVLANSDTLLAANDVFYFGNVIGELNIGNTATRLRVNGQDVALILANQSPGANSVNVTNIFDLDRNGRVNGLDYSILLANQQAAGIVAPITAPAARPAGASKASSSSSSRNAVPFQITLNRGTNDSAANVISTTSNPSTLAGKTSTFKVALSLESTKNKSVIPTLSDATSLEKKERDSSKLESLDAFFATLWS